MKRMIGMILAVILTLCFLSGCAGDHAGSMDNEKTTVSASPMIVTPNPSNGMIEDDDGRGNGTGSYATSMPSGTAPSSPTAGNRN